MKVLQQTIDQLIHLNDTEWSALSALFQPKQLQKKTYFANCGEYASQFALVETGVLRAFYRTDMGEEYNKTFFCPNTFVGAYASLITGNQNLIDIQCLTDCTVWIADYPSFTKLFDAYPKIERIARLLAEQYFIQKEKREIHLVTLDAKERYQVFQTEHPNLEQLIPQYHIASYLGISATQLSRIRAAK